MGQTIIRETSKKDDLSVLQVLPSLSTGGVERGAVDIARAIVNAGGRALVVSSGGVMTGELERAGATHVELPVHSKNPITMGLNIGRLTSLIRENQVRIIHARSRAPAWSSYYAARRAKIPFITTFHGSYSDENCLKHFYNSIMSKGDKVIAISDFISDLVINNYGVDPARVSLVPRGIDIDAFHPSRVSGARLKKLVEEWRVPDDYRVILLPGRLTNWKGQSVLIEALARLKNKEGLRCILAGSAQGRTRYVKELEDQISRLNLQGMVHMVGDCKDMPSAMLMSDVVVSASIEAEAFGRVIVEAQAMGRPVIATDHGAARETVIPEVGWLVPPNDPDALAKALTEVLSLDQKSRSDVSKRSMTHVREKYTRSNMCAQTLAVYRSVYPSFSANA